MKFLKKQELYKASQSFLVIIAIMLITGGVGIVNIYNVSQLTSEIYVQNVQPTAKINQINNLLNLYRLKVYQQIASIEINEKLLKEIVELSATIDQELSLDNALFLMEEEREQFKKVSQLWRELEYSYGAILELSLNYAKEEALELIAGENQTILESQHQAISELLALKTQGIESAYQRSQTIKVRTLWITSITLLAGIALCLYLIFQKLSEFAQINVTLEQNVLVRTKELEKSTAELAEKEEQFRIALDSMTGGMFMIDKDFNLQVFNENFRKLYNLPPDVLKKGKHISNILRIRAERGEYGPGDPEELVKKRIDGFYRGKKEVLRYEDIVHGNRIIEMVRAPTKYGGTVAVCNDITERRKGEEELKTAKQAAEAANRAKSEFLANMSHELRTPLNGILGYAQILEKEKDLSKRQRNGIEVIHRSGEYLLNLINEVLDFSKIEAGKMELNITQFDLPNMLYEISDVFLIRAQHKKISFYYDQLSELPQFVSGDEKKIRQIIINLLSNAIKFTEKGGVVLKTGYHENRIRFQVEDTGVGIPEEFLKTIFDSFQQVGQKNQIVEGTGLGLAISYRLATLMDSALHVTSELNQGSTFWFDLDLPELTGMSNTVNQEKREVIGFHGPAKTVLIVDDKEENRAVLVDMLTPLGFKIVEAVDGFDCLAQTEQHKPDLILLDIRMPEMDGFEALTRIRKMPFGQEIVVIVVTASAFVHNRQESLDAGSNDFIAKPFRLEQLLSLLQQHMQLDWIYADSVTNAPLQESESAHSLSGEKVRDKIPSVEVMKKLYDLATRGDIKGFQKQIDQLQEQDQQLTAFVSEVRPLAKSFQMEKIQSLIEELLKE